MNINDFDYILPAELIADYPLPKRSDSKLLNLSIAEGTLAHLSFRNLIDKLNPGDLLVLNNTRVIPARLFAKKTTGGQCEILVERIIDDFHVYAHVRASKAPKEGTILHVAAECAFIMKNRKDDLFLLEANHPVQDILCTYGHMPIPSYINRSDETLDKERYQTVYAQTSGAVAAPTAGLHFDEELLQKLKAKGIQLAFVTLHVGAGTFQPVRVENILEHKMHFEFVEVSAEVCNLIKQTHEKKGRVIAVGTTTVRSLETAAMHGELKPFKGETNLFIYPGYKFQVIDGLITNFHLPKSTLFILVCAFAGMHATKKAYQEAIDHQYRFYSYGDAMLIL